MDPSNLQKQNEPEEPRYLDFPCSDEPILNKYSSTLTRGHDFPGAQAMLYAAGVPDEKTMRTAAQVGVACVWVSTSIQVIYDESSTDMWV